MLSMKTLRVAIVTMGSALLFGSGLAIAQYDINLNGTEATSDAPMPLVFAQETLPAAEKGLRALELDDVMNVLVKPRRAIGESEDVYLRVDLAGARFGAAPTVWSGPAGSLNTNDGAMPSSGGAGESFAVFSIGGVAAGDVVGIQIGANAGDGGDLQLSIGSGNVTASIAAYTNPDDALDQVAARNTFAGSGPILRLVSGLTVTIKAADTAVASVDHGFLWFAGPTGQARLGWLGLVENENIMAGVRDASDGGQLARGDILTQDSENPPNPLGMVSFNIMGNLDIGAFSVERVTYTQERTAAPADPTLEVDGQGNRFPAGTCDGVTADNAPDRGNLVDAEGMPLIGKDGERPSGVASASTGDKAPGIYVVCLNVDVMGPETNMYAIPEGDYTATAHFKTGRNPLERAQMAGMEGKLASIERNGASVEIPYLTTSDKHNQRVIVVNRGTRPVAITAITFTSEDGTDVELSDTAQAAMDAGQLVVPGNSTWVARMDETLNITGDSRRTAATIAFAATSGALSVATTQVNLEDGSTDTVVYTID